MLKLWPLAATALVLAACDTKPPPPPPGPPAYTNDAQLSAEPNTTLTFKDSVAASVGPADKQEFETTAEWESRLRLQNKPLFGRPSTTPVPLVFDAVLDYDADHGVATICAKSPADDHPNTDCANQGDDVELFRMLQQFKNPSFVVSGSIRVEAGGEYGKQAPPFLARIEMPTERAMALDGRPLRIAFVMAFDGSTGPVLTNLTSTTSSTDTIKGRLVRRVVLAEGHPIFAEDVKATTTPQRGG